MGTVFRQKGRSTWMIKYYRDGKPIYESSGTDIKDEAKKTLQSREGDIADGRPVMNKAGRLRFKQAFTDVENDHISNQRRSLDHVKMRIRLHLMPAFGHRRLTATTDADIREYISERLKAKAKPATINRELAIIRRAYRLNPKIFRPTITMLAEKNTRKGFFEREQFQAVLKHLPEPWRPVMTFAYYTGWRTRSEILLLTWGAGRHGGEDRQTRPGHQQER